LDNSPIWFSTAKKKVMLLDEICCRTKGLSIAFDLITAWLWFRSRTRSGWCGKKQELPTSVEDMKVLFDQIP
jgi:hypothetical protein